MLQPDRDLVEAVRLAAELGKRAGEKIPVTWTTLLVGILGTHRDSIPAIGSPDEWEKILKHALAEKGLRKSDLQVTPEFDLNAFPGQIFTSSADRVLEIATGYGEGESANWLDSRHIAISYLFAPLSDHSRQTHDWGLDQRFIRDAYEEVFNQLPALKRKIWKAMISAPHPKGKRWKERTLGDFKISEDMIENLRRVLRDDEVSVKTHKATVKAVRSGGKTVRKKSPRTEGASVKKK
ncbi:MAG: hypothetical protein OEY97_12125 [Nitrospirota bacterium]|nr:hypothetical protein [Nitrospirota bacterium]